MNLTSLYFNDDRPQTLKVSSVTPVGACAAAPAPAPAPAPSPAPAELQKGLCNMD